MKQLSDDELVKGYRDLKTPEYLAEIFLRYSDSAFRTAFQFSGNNADAEDAVQVAFVKCMHDLYQYQLGTNLRAWLMRIVINTCKNKKIEEKRRSSRLEKYSAQNKGYINAENTQEKEELQQMVRKSVALLPEKYRTPIWLVLFEEFSYADASRSLELPEKTLRTQVARGLERLRGQLQKAGVALSIPLITELTLNTPLEAASDSFKNKCADVATSPNSIATNIATQKATTSTIISFLAITLILAGGYLAWISFINEPQPNTIIPTNISPKFKSIQKWNFDENENYSGIKPVHGKVYIINSLGVNKSNCLYASEGSMFELDISEFQLPIKITLSNDYIVPRGNKIQKGGINVFKSSYPSNKNIFNFAGLRKVIRLSDSEIAKRSKNQNIKKGYFGQWFKRTIYVTEDCIDIWFDGIRKGLVYGTSTDNKKIYIYSLSSGIFDNIIIESVKPEIVPNHSKFSSFVNKFPLQKKSILYDLKDDCQQLSISKNSYLAVYEKKRLEETIGLSNAGDEKALTFGSK
ncbi:MAG: hypothetical protein COA79_23770 [Planctomycetota bacterium]|nr:MAG: hypothetical protein COA79_23770 [Planctomycetota bacterium]